MTDIIERLDDFWPDDSAERMLIADSMREIEKLRAEVNHLTDELGATRAEMERLRGSLEMVRRNIRTEGFYIISNAARLKIDEALEGER